MKEQSIKFKNVDDIAGTIHQAIMSMSLPSRSITNIKNDFHLMLGGYINDFKDNDIIGVMIARYLGVYHTDLLPELIRCYSEKAERILSEIQEEKTK